MMHYMLDVDNLVKFDEKLTNSPGTRYEHSVVFLLTSPFVSQIVKMTICLVKI